MLWVIKSKKYAEYELVKQTVDKIKYFLVGLGSPALSF